MSCTTYYSECSSITINCHLYADPNGTIPVTDGYYSDGLHCYSVASGVVIGVSSC